MKARYRLLLLLTAASLWCGSAKLLHAGSLTAAVETIHVKELRKHCEVLASDALEGRESGTRGGQAAGAYIVDLLRTRKVPPSGTEGDYFQPFPPNGRNILAVLRGSDPTLRNEYVLIGAHYDHVGFGTARNSRGPIGYIHNGADDNASGAAALLELVDAFISLDAAPKRSLLFAFWDAEEKGLLGSQYWTNAPTVPLQQIRLAINIDMIGRLRDNRADVFGSRTAPGLREFVAHQNFDSPVRLTFLCETRRDSDHYNFYSHRIPYLMIFTGKHPEYHTPYDDVDKLNVEGMEHLTRLLFRTAFAAAQQATLPHFRDTAFQEGSQTQLDVDQPAPPLPSRLGITWDEGWAQRGVVQLVEIEIGSAAASAGLQPGDRILEFDGQRIDSGAKLREAVFSAGPSAKAVVKGMQDRSPRTINVSLPPVTDPVGVWGRFDDAEPGCLVVNRVSPGSPAQRAGLRVGDRIERIGGVPVESPGQIESDLRSPRGRDIQFERDGQERRARLTLRAPIDTPRAPR